MYFGVDYYPEHWNASMMDEDIDRMVEMGVNIVRIGEFAWHIMESTEGNFDFSFFDKVIEKLKKRNIKVMFGTPTATTPAWLIKKHPNILSKDENLLVRGFGGRRQYCYNSKVYLEYSEKIVKKLVEHYKNEDAIVAWQIDNEFGHEGSDMCYCEKCHKVFHKFLEKKYKNIDILNEAWGTVFWSQTYNEFDEIPIPLKTITHHNPSLQLDFARFRSESLNNYAKSQIKYVRNNKGEHQQVTTNLAGGFMDKYFDHEVTVEDMDFTSYDNYPVWGGLKEPMPPFAIAADLDFIRGLKDKNFWIVEQLMGAQGHTVIGYLPRPNQAKMWSYQSFAHGCENMLYFRWRSATFGAEEFCFGIIDHDNKSGRKFKEVQSLIKEVSKHEELVNSEIKSDIAVVYDYENIWAWKIQPQSSSFDFKNEVLRLYEPFYKLNTHIDIISTKKDFNKYKVLLLPVMMLSDENISNKIHKFVENGGTLILSFRAGIKNRNNNISLGSVSPGIYRDLAGIEISDIESLQEGQMVKIRGVGDFASVKSNCKVWRDIIDCKDAEALYKYDDKFFSDKACITVNNYGKGKVYYIGAGVSAEILLPIAKKIVVENSIDYIESEEGVEAYTREVNGKKYFFLMNHNEEDVRFKDINLKPYESMIIER